MTSIDEPREIEVRSSYSWRHLQQSSLVMFRRLGWRGRLVCWSAFIVAFVLSAAGAAIMIYRLHSGALPPDFGRPLFLGAAYALGIIFLSQSMHTRVVRRFMERRIARDAPETLRIGPAGIEYRGPHARGLVEWQGITAIERSRGLTHFFTAFHRAYLVPDECLPEGTNPDAFVEQVQIWKEAAE